MELNINSLPDFVKNATILWNMGADSVPQVMRTSGLVKEMAIPQMSGNTREFSEIDLNQYARAKGESEQAARAKVQQGYTKIGTLRRIASDIGITYEMRTQGKYSEIKQKLINLGEQAPNRLDLDLSHRITFGTATSYVDMDGVTIDTTVGDTLALFSTAHTLRGSSTTFRNRLANNPQVSRGSLEAMGSMRKQNTYNQFGEKMIMKDDILWTTDDETTVNTVKEILRSTANPTQANPNVENVYKGSYTHVILPRVATDANGGNDTTKLKYWGVCSSANSTFNLGMHEEAHMKAMVGSINSSGFSAANGEDFATDDWSFGTRAGYMIVIVSASWIGFSSGDGTS
jgi:hypothetical protein